VKLLLILLLLFGQAWTEDRGEAASEAELMALGPDVAARIGPPVGPRRSGAELRDATEALAGKLRCPVCQGLSVADSTSESARNMKAQIEAMLAAGYEAEQVVDYFTQTYGEFLLMLPKAQGFNLLAYGAPVLGVLVALGMAWWTVRRSVDEVVRDAPEEAGDQADGDLDPYLARVRQELADD
jgi:cytochrome c-type biogenesis protein CcmH